MRAAAATLAVLAALASGTAPAATDEQVNRLVSAAVAAGLRAGGPPVPVVPVEITAAQRAQYECVIDRLTEARSAAAAEQFIAMVEVWATATTDEAGEASVAFLTAHGEAYAGVVSECIDPEALR